MVAIAAWLLLAVVILVLGKLCDCQAMIGAGAVMLLMLAMVDDISW